MMHRLRGTTAVVGIGKSGMGGQAPGYTALELMAEASFAALDDAGLSLADVDGLFVSSSMHAMPTLSAAEYLGIRPAYMNGSMIGGASFIAHLLNAALALDAGLCDVALIAYGSNQRSAGGKLMTLSEPQPYEAVYKPRYPISSYALATARHMHQYGTTRRQLAEVAVAARRWAMLNPEAAARAPLEIDEVLAAPMVCDPLSRLDCCLVTDGGAAVVMTRADRAGDMRHAPAYLLGCAVAHSNRQIAQMDDLTVTAAAESGRRAFAIAGLGVRDVSIAQLYDAFTINTILFLEDLGFCPKGEGGRFVENGAIAPGGRLAVNTNGGGLSCIHPGMYGLHLVIEAVEQIRRQAGARQQPDVDVVLAHGNGGTLSSQATALLGTRNSL
ncbi:acetyl-CoA acetyltransferase [Xanthobacteraceae bacterium A53D]